MTRWTDGAREGLERYFAQIRPTVQASGADPEEVIEDLRRHLEAEAQAAGLTLVTEQDLRRLLQRIGAPDPPAVAPAEGANRTGPTGPTGRTDNADGGERTPAVRQSPAGGKVPRVGWVTLLAGVVLPAVTFVIEWVTGMCAGAFFDPMPTVAHGLLVAAVPVVNLLAWLAIRRGDAGGLGKLIWGNGFALGVAAFYSLLFLPLMLPGVFAIIFFGWGLLPWAPMLALIAGVVLRTRLRQLRPADQPGRPGGWAGMALAALVLVLIALPTAVTRMALVRAVDASSEEQTRAIRWLRVIGSKDALLRACYGYTRNAANFDVLGWIATGGEVVAPEKARETYFRVTGQPFNAVPPPSVRTARGAFQDLNEWTWDADHGGERVGGRLKGLGLLSSRMDTQVDSDGGWAYTEWTLEFQNTSVQAREARAQVLLPPGGVVSRLTLWVNGEEREAAFAGRAQVREAYQEIAVRQRRDPVLVTTAGPDRIQVQCFPVPANGGVMKIRFGVTSPLVIEAASEGTLRLPVFLERNFSIPVGLDHAVWVESAAELSAASTRLVAESSRPGFRALRGSLDDRELGSPGAFVRVVRDPAVRVVWTKDTREGEGRVIRQTLKDEPGKAASQVVVVVDGSRDMKAVLPDVAAALRELPAGVERTILVASDEGAGGATNSSSGPGAVSVSDEELARWSARGGQDNIPALLRAWNIAAPRPGSAIVWVHGPQPMRLSAMSGLLQATERTANPPALYEVQVEPGPDRVVEELDRLRSLRPLLRRGPLGADLARLFKGLGNGAPEWRWVREQLPTATEADTIPGKETGLHLARLWAADEIRRLHRSQFNQPAIAMAQRYQLVTTVSGAVVLENQQQYAQTGLTPVDPQTVPSIPEPSTLVLLAAGAGVLWWQQRRRAVRGRSGR